MLKRSSERLRAGFMLAVLISAVLVRMVLAWGAAARPPETEQTAATIPQAAEKTSLAPVLTRQSVPAPTPEPEQPQLKLPVFDERDAAIWVGGGSSYPVDVAEALKTQWRAQTKTLPAVLIVHTHGTESYTAEPGWEYEGDENLRTTDGDYSVVRVGQALAEALEERGITVYHDRTMHDLESFSGAYNASRQTVQGYLSRHPGIGLVIDLHRDAAENPDGSAYAPRITVDGTEYARLMLVVGTDEGGLNHPDWRKNFACAAQLQALLNRSLPGLCRDMDLRTERFNQDLSTGALLIEMGAAGNTLAQALASAEVLADAVARLLGAEA